MPRVRLTQPVGAPRFSPLLVPRMRAHADVLLPHGLKLSERGVTEAASGRALHEIDFHGTNRRC